MVQVIEMCDSISDTGSMIAAANTRPPRTSKQARKEKELSTAPQSDSASGQPLGGLLLLEALLEADPAHTFDCSPVSSAVRTIQGYLAQCSSMATAQTLLEARLALKCLASLPVSTIEANADLLEPLLLLEAPVAAPSAVWTSFQSQAVTCAAVLLAGCEGFNKAPLQRAALSRAKQLIVHHGRRPDVLIACERLFSVISVTGTKRSSANASKDVAKPTKRAKTAGGAALENGAAHALGEGSFAVETAEIDALLPNLASGDVAVRVATWKLLGCFDQPAFVGASAMTTDSDLPRDLVALGLRMDTATLDPLHIGQRVICLNQMQSLLSHQRESLRSPTRAPRAFRSSLGALSLGCSCVQVCPANMWRLSRTSLLDNSEPASTCCGSQQQNCCLRSDGSMASRSRFSFILSCRGWRTLCER